MTTYPQETDWIGKGWHTAPPKPYKVYRDNEGYVVLFCDRNGWKHALFTWADGGATFQWKTAWVAPGDMEVISVPAALLKLADAWQEYLDAVVERETG
jgi:hypothetical protein